MEQDERMSEAAAEEVAEAASAEQSETEQLRRRVSELEAQLAERERQNERVGRECAEFERYFPEVSLRGVPDEVWEQVHAGVPLAAAYALYDRGRQNASRADAADCERRASMPTGIGEAAGQEYFSPAQVRAMSSRQVRENYDRIFESMRHWQ